DNETNMPSLSKETISALLAGNLTDWGLLRGQTGTALGTSGSSDMTVYVARRQPSSGTQHAAEIFFLSGSNPTDGSHSTKCNTSARQMVASTGTGAADAEATACPPSGTPPQITFQGSGTGNVRQCLSNHDANSRYAIGIISTETPYTSADNNSEQGKNLRFVKIDGYSPSLINVATGRYKYWVEQSSQTPAYFGSLPTDEQAGVA